MHSTVACCCDLVGGSEGRQPLAACQPQASTNLSWMAGLLGKRDVCMPLSTGCPEQDLLCQGNPGLLNCSSTLTR